MNRISKEYTSDSLNVRFDDESGSKTSFVSLARNSRTTQRRCANVALPFSVGTVSFVTRLQLVDICASMICSFDIGKKKALIGW